MKPGEEVVSVNVGWTVERFVAEEKDGTKKDAGKKKPATKAKTSAMKSVKKTKSLKGGKSVANVTLPKTKRKSKKK